MTAFKVAIPARYASTRLPGKPLSELAGKPMIRHVYERGLESGADEVVIATDDARIAEAARGFGADVVLTAADHVSGTDRLAEAARIRAWDGDAIVVNLQGDEPLMPGALLRRVADDLAAFPDAAVSTLAVPIRNRREVFDPHAVKVVTDRAGYALNFSRAPMPWWRDGFADAGSDALPEEAVYYRHLGIYAYRAGFLARYNELSPSPLELVESLEQLRALWHGYRIHVHEVEEPPGHGVDTVEDLERARRKLEEISRR